MNLYSLLATVSTQIAHTLALRSPAWLRASALVESVPSLVAISPHVQTMMTPGFSRMMPGFYSPSLPRSLASLASLLAKRHMKWFNTNSNYDSRKSNDNNTETTEHCHLLVLRCCSKSCLNNFPNIYFCQKLK